MLIDLEEWGDLREDFYDVLVSESRKNEPTVPWSEPKAERATVSDSSKI